MRKQAGKRLNDWLETNNLTQAQLARLLGVKQQSVSDWVIGRRAPNDNLAMCLAMITHIPSREWLTPKDAKRRADVLARVTAYILEREAQKAA